MTGDIEELKKAAEAVMKLGVEQVLEDGEVMPCFHLVLKDGGVEIVVAEGRGMNSPTYKDKLSALIRSRIETGDVVAVIFVSDTFWGTFTPEQERARQILRLSVEEAGKTGLCPNVREGVTVILESPIFQRLMRQEYRRDQTNTAHCELVGDPEITDGTEWTLGKGRFSGFWPQQDEARAAQ